MRTNGDVWAAHGHANRPCLPPEAVRREVTCRISTERVSVLPGCALSGCGAEECATVHMTTSGHDYIRPGTYEPPGPYVVTELSLSNLTAEQAQGEHPERTPVGPFGTREAADKWASEYVGRFGGSGSWSLAPIHPPR